MTERSAVIPEHLLVPYEPEHARLDRPPKPPSPRQMTQLKVALEDRGQQTVRPEQQPIDDKPVPIKAGYGNIQQVKKQFPISRRNNMSKLPVHVGIHEDLEWSTNNSFENNDEVNIDVDPLSIGEFGVDGDSVAKNSSEDMSTEVNNYIGATVSDAKMKIASARTNAELNDIASDTLSKIKKLMSMVDNDVKDHFNGWDVKVKNALRQAAAERVAAVKGQKQEDQSDRAPMKTATEEQSYVRPGQYCVIFKGQTQAVTSDFKSITEFLEEFLRKNPNVKLSDISVYKRLNLGFGVYDRSK